MSARACIQAKIRAGRIRAAAGDKLLKQLDVLEAQHGATLGSATAAKLARGDLAQLLKADLARKKRLAALAIRRAAEIDRILKTHPEGEAAAARNLLIRETGGRDRAGSVEYTRLAIGEQARAGMVNTLRKLRSKWAGLSRDTDTGRDIVRALFGETHQSKIAGALAGEWAKTAEMLRRRFNAAGGDIPELKSWRLPQAHDVVDIAAAGLEKWKATVMPLLDRQAILSDRTGLPVTDRELNDLLDAVFDTLASDGLTALSPGARNGRGGGGMLAQRRQEHRVLLFKDADAWLSYQDAFGKADVLNVLMNHIDRMAGDIAQLEVLGPNPAHMVDYLADRATQAVYAATGKPDAARTEGDAIREIFRDLAGEFDRPGRVALAKAGAAVRAGLVSAQLGGAFLSSLGDLWTQGITRAMNRLPIMQMIPDMLSLALDEDRAALAVQLGLGSESWARTAREAGRHAGELMRGGMMQGLADSTLRASLLAPFTEAGQRAFSLEYAGLLGRNAGKALQDLPEAQRRAFANYGIDARAWDLVRGSVRSVNGAPFLDLPALSASTRNRETLAAAAAVHRMILSERDLAVIQPDMRTRHWLRSAMLRDRPGTLRGELGRSIAMYKSFPLTLLHTHWARALNQAQLGDRVAYAAALFIGLSVFGAVAYQAKQLARGKTAADMDPSTDEGRAFYGAAILQGGGAGILGDFFFADQNRFGQNIQTTLAGPVLGAANDFGRLVIGNAQEALRGEDTDFAAEAIQMTARYLPGSSLWQTRLLFERSVVDQLTRLADPDYEGRIRRLERKMQRETEQEFWWTPGETTP